MFEYIVTATRGTDEYVLDRFHADSAPLAIDRKRTLYGTSPDVCLYVRVAQDEKK